MSKRKPIVLLVIAAFLGLLATTAAGRYLEKQSGAVAEPGKVILAAAVDLSPGTRLTREAVREVVWPAQEVPSSFVTSWDDATDWYVTSPLAAGEPLVRNKLSQQSLTGKITGYIPSGYRAMAIKIDRAIRAGGLLDAGCFVDVLTVMTQRGRPPVSKIILQNIKVLSVGVRKTEDDGEDDSGAATTGLEEVVTLLLQPDEAEKLALAMTRGKIQVMARGTSDTASVVTAGFSSDAFLPKEDVTPAKVEDAEAEVGTILTAKTLLNKAHTLEAQGELEAAREVYKQIVEEFTEDRVAVEAAQRLKAIADEMEQKLKESRLEEAVASALDLLNKGLFEDCRKGAKSILEEFGSLTYRGEKITDIVSNITVKADAREKRARVDFQLFSNFLNNGNKEKAQFYLRKLERGYPASTCYRKAAEMMANAENNAQPGEQADAREQVDHETGE